MPEVDPIDDGEDAWDYSFPPSTDSLPLEQSSTLQQSQATNQRPSGLTRSDSDEQQSRQIAQQIDIINKLRQAESSEVGSNGVRSSLSLTSTFSKTPLNPLTTKEDASSVISKDSSTKKSTSELENNDKPRFLKNLQSIDANNQTTSPTSNESNDLDRKLGSPKIIAYRKSRRTISESTFDSFDPSTSLSTPPPTSKFDTRLYVDEFYKDSKYRYATIKRNVEFHQMFNSLDLTDRLLDDFSCALSREILLQGRAYVSESYLCFNSNLLGWVTNLTLKFDDIVKFEKRSTAGLFPNGISVETEDGTVHTFASFLSRDQTYDLMTTVWKGKTGRTNRESVSFDSPEATSHADSSSLANVTSPRVQSYIMSLDGDDESTSKDQDDDTDQNQDDSDNDETPNNEPPQQNGELLPALGIISKRTKITKLKPDSKYQNLGPDTHAPTTAKYTKFPQEVDLIETTIDAPLGVVFAILFGPNTDFQLDFLKRHDGSEISDLTEFRPSIEDPTLLAREYTYRRQLGYSIGPKSTRCEVTETIEHMNLADYVVVTITTQTPDVPSGNAFAVKARYVFTWGESNTTNLLISLYVEWKGRSWMKSVIEKSSISGSTTTLNELVTELKDEVDRNVYRIDGPSETAPKKKKKKVAVDEKKAQKVKSEVITPSPGTGALISRMLHPGYILALVVIWLQLVILYKLMAIQTALQMHFGADSPR
ncbi:hypothetical protein KGF57_001034 [Candida theae]|uniref:VASt domain-containing protein n=1 Tax=Candida theae TaxID=1198502 RepID=A0AAD5BI54_9ASCO|nr:uncharacterized protein KGF57_001034 [Candida theae]KAI5964542.1 hypothetical protein KGF57_001034 [Candida theae]